VCRTSSGWQAITPKREGGPEDPIEEKIMTARAYLATSVALVIALATLNAQKSETYGAGVTLKETTPLAQVIDKPASFEGKTLRVEGTVTAVCMHMGCWMALTPDAASSSKTMLIKVDDGVIVFPPSAKGRRAVAQGVIEKIGGGESQEAASEQARSTGSAAPTWQLKATGALVYE
jgi:hypothetical protein